jgi:hypothetical protein
MRNRVTVGRTVLDFDSTTLSESEGARRHDSADR